MAEDFTAYSNIVNPGAVLTVAVSKIDFTALDNDTDAYAADNKGAANYSGDYGFFFECKITGQTAAGRVYLVTVANALDDANNLTDYQGCYITYSTGAAAYRFQLQERDASTDYGSGATYDIDVDTLYYCDFYRDDDEGTYGTIHLDVYTSAADRSTRSNAVFNQSVACNSSKKDWQYLYGVLSQDTNNPTWDLTGYIENLTTFRPRDVAGTSAANSTASGIANVVVGNMSGSSAALSNASGVFNLVRGMAGTSAGLSGASGWADIIRNYDFIELDGNIDQGRAFTAFIDQQADVDGNIDQQRNYILEK